MTPKEIALSLFIVVLLETVHILFGIPPGVFPVGLVLIFVGWVIFEIWPARVQFKGDWIVKKHKFKTEKIQLADLAKIEFHYHAVVGFICVWEFTANSGYSFSVEGNGIDQKLISNLERHLPNFQGKNFYQAFKDGDVVETIEVWRAT